MNISRQQGTLVCVECGLWWGRCSPHVKGASREDNWDEYRRLTKMADSTMRIKKMWQLPLHLFCQDKDQSTLVKGRIFWLLLMSASIIAGNTNCFVFKLKIMFQVLAPLIHRFSHLFVQNLAPTSLPFHFKKMQIFKYVPGVSTSINVYPRFPQPSPLSSLVSLAVQSHAIFLDIINSDLTGDECSPWPNYGFTLHFQNQCLSWC